MRIAVSTTGTTLEAPLEPRFGRAPRFLIWDQNEGKVVLLDNKPNVHATQGAGVQAATLVSRANVEGVVTGHCGPKAFRVLDAAGIKVFLSRASTVQEALDEIRQGRLSPSGGADVEGHWA
jgi:predicted Fe-Mo cluster-binding NifX family protein